jgi:hypothetical protein
VNSEENMEFYVAKGISREKEGDSSKYRTEHEYKDD